MTAGTQHSSKTERKTISDFKFPGDEKLKCSHCDREFGPTAEALLEIPYLLVACDECGLLTAFHVESYRTKKQEARRKKEEHVRQNPTLFQD